MRRDAARSCPAGARAFPPGLISEPLAMFSSAGGDDGEDEANNSTDAPRRCAHFYARTPPARQTNACWGRERGRKGRGRGGVYLFTLESVLPSTSDSYKRISRSFLVLLRWFRFGWFVARSVPNWCAPPTCQGDRQLSQRAPGNCVTVCFKVTSAGQEDLGEHKRLQAWKGSPSSSAVVFKIHKFRIFQSKVSSLTS